MYARCRDVRDTSCSTHQQPTTDDHSDRNFVPQQLGHQVCAVGVVSGRGAAGGDTGWPRRRRAADYGHLFSSALQLSAQWQQTR